ncbi:MAG: argininosuccinate lyase [Clostridiales bacterium]|nr:argininosuccinate lyase [Clostridiales bacterium]
MVKLWAGRTDANTNKVADDFNSSIGFDSKMYEQDIKGSLAHVLMLKKQGIISADDYSKISDGLIEILEDLKSGTLNIDFSCEDIHTFVETELISRIGETGKKLHTARSRNDQVATDLKLYLKDKTADIIKMTVSLIDALVFQAENNLDAIMPGYTHLQRAQPISFAFHMCAYCMMFLRDKDRLTDAVKRMNYSPLGSCALAGTGYDTDREFTAKELGFDGISMNAEDAVSDRDYCVELLSAYSVLMMHMSRLSEEIIMWSSWEFGFVKLDDGFTTGSSIMPQKKNPDMAELVRGKTGRVYGDLFAMLTVLKGLPLAYNKDLQEDKESIFDAIETVTGCLDVFAPMVKTMKTQKDKMLSAAKKGFINATDVADYLTKKGMPFRDAYKLSGQLVTYCEGNGKVLDEVTLEEYKKMSELFEEDIYESIDLSNCVNSRNSEGGTSSEQVKKQIDFIKKSIKIC